MYDEYYDEVSRMRLLIDTDTASDDAVALVMALCHPEAQVEAITVVSGNSPLEQVVQNALYTVELCGAAVPVYAGMAKPLMRPIAMSQHVHGQDGMGDIGLLLRGREAAPGHAVDVLRAIINRYLDEIVLVTLGPLTNVALALLLEPSLATKVARCVIMGGASNYVGNSSIVAEYNIWADPEAAKLVFESGMAITMVGWDVSLQYAVMAAEDVAALRAIGTPLAAFCVDIQAVLDRFCREQQGLAGFDLPDPITMAVALDSRVALTTRQAFVTVETGDGLTRGQTVVDYHGRLGHPANTTVVLEASRSRFLELLHAAVATDH